MAVDPATWQVDTSTPAVILKLDRNVFHHGGLGVARTLGRLGVPVHLVYEDVLAPAAASRYVYGRWRWNPDLDDPDRIRDGLLRLAERIGRPAVLIPTDDAGAIFLAEHGAPLRERFLFPAPDQALPRRVAGKDSLAELCREGMISCPRSLVPASLDEALAFVETVGLPVFVKLAQPWQPRRGGRARSTTLVESRDALAAFYPSSGEPGPGRVLLQECVPGGPGTDWFFHGYCDAGSVCRPSFTGVKLRSYPAYAGLTTLGDAIGNERLCAEVLALLSRLHYRGAVDLDLRWDARARAYRLLDFNPRIGAQFRVFEERSGLDVARAAYLDLTGQPAPDPAPAVPRRFVVENYDLLAGLAYVRHGDLGLRGWLDSLRGVDETAWFARDDLTPFGLMCLRFGWRALTRWRRSDGYRSSPRPPVYRRGRAQTGHAQTGRAQTGQETRSPAPAKGSRARMKEMTG
jgi:predicted ATP-grasp superfamily ATP-dependent carboligase